MLQIIGVGIKYFLLVFLDFARNDKGGGLFGFLIIFNMGLVTAFAQFTEFVELAFD